MNLLLDYAIEKNIVLELDNKKYENHNRYLYQLNHSIDSGHRAKERVNYLIENAKANYLILDVNKKI